MVQIGDIQKPCLHLYLKCVNVGGAFFAFSQVSGAKTATLQVNTTAGLNGWQFRCIVTDGDGNPLPSKEATLTVK